MGMPIHVCMHGYLQKQNATQYAKPNAGYRLGTLSAVSWNLLADLTCSVCEGVALKIFLPLNEVLGFWTVVQESAVRPERSLLCFFCSRISAEKECKGWGPDTRATINATSKSVK